MRTFCKINPTLWASKRFKKLDGMPRLFYIYCITSPHSNSTGCYHLRPGYAMIDLKISEGDFFNCIDTVSEDGLIRYDKHEEVVYIDRWFDFNQPNNPKHCLKIISELKQIPDIDLRHISAQKFHDFVKTTDWDKSTIIRYLNPLLSRPLDTVSRLGNTETETETKTETQTETKKEAKKETKTPKPKKEKINGKRFEQWLSENGHSGLPADWREYAQSKGCRQEFIREQATLFSRYWTGPDATGNGIKKDWFRTWQNWIDRAVTLAGSRSTVSKTKRAEAAADLGLEIYRAGRQSTGDSQGIDNSVLFDVKTLWQGAGEPDEHSRAIPDGSRKLPNTESAGGLFDVLENED